jgi:hypothetical protein
MTIAPGTRLGPYDILSPLGASGMGEVWRARDPWVGREVAGPEFVLLSEATCPPKLQRRRKDLLSFLEITARPSSHKVLWRTGRSSE